VLICPDNYRGENEFIDEEWRITGKYPRQHFNTSARPHMVNFFRNPFFLPWIYPQLTWRIPTAEKELFLTFDDGPVPGPTDFVLETLSKSNIRANFFCIGDNIQKNPAVFNKIIANGHTIGNHTFNHLSGWKTSTEKYLSNVKQCDSQIDSMITGYRLQDASGEENPHPGTGNLFRPPYGRITRNQIKALSGYNIIMWDVLTHDYAQSLSPNKCLSGSIAAARPGSIVVFHDSYKAERNMTYVLPRFIDHFSNQGYRFTHIL
jgi:peptidoglycan/xylan/chitin deacetylase (PgdA/CDA1 family)